ncbi:MAG TPA: PadR family transcriptional regulator [Candidatus Dormibacteraeota bacterium]
MKQPGRPSWRDPGLLVLSTLADGPRHGYAIVQEARKQAGITLGPGTLYGALSRLEAYGLVVALPVEGRRRPYQLSQKGRETLEAQMDAMARFLRINGHLEERGLFTPVPRATDHR